MSSKWSKTWRVPGAPSKKRAEGLREWSQRDILWTCKLGKDVNDDDKCIAWLKDKKQINASKVKASEGWIYSFGNHWVRYCVGQHWHTRNPQDGDFLVVFTDESFAIMPDETCKRLYDLIRIRQTDERLKNVANPFGVSQADLRKAKEVK